MARYADDAHHVSGEVVAEVLRLSARVVRSSPDLAASRQVVHLLASTPIRILAALDHALRDRGAHRDAGVRFVVPTTEDVLAWSVPPEPAVGAYGLASCIRNGYVREIAIQRLSVLTGPLATGFLMMRVADYVAPVAAVAWSVAPTWITPSRADDLVQVLPLLRRLVTWRRGRDLRMERQIGAILASDDPAVLPALWSGAGHRDSEVRREACALLLQRLRGAAAVGDVFDAALDDADPGTRVWAARCILDPTVTPPEVRLRFLPLLEDDRSPAVRVLALSEAIAGGAWDAVVRATLDGNSLLRYIARKKLRGTGLVEEVRPRALAVLAHKERPVRELVGALAALSEVARREDIPVIVDLMAHPNARVAAEARRTRGLLSE